MIGVNDIADIHIGSRIREVLVKKQMTISEFAGRISRDRTTLYNIFKRKSLDIELLLLISNALDFDFIHEVYFPKNNGKSSSKILISFDIEKNEVRKLDLPEEFVP